MIWANLLHLGVNLWADRDTGIPNAEYITAQPKLRCDKDLWDDVTQRMSDVGMNMVIVDLADGVKYQSHPEIAVDGAWSVDELKAELSRLRSLGLEPIPKLNFSTTHDIWLGPYSRCVSTPLYYNVCRDLIAEAIDIFGKPRFFHLGMDEENIANHKQWEYVVIRQYDLWWHDFNFFVEQAEKGGARAWIWSDYMWDHPEVFKEKMPKSIVQSNWYYHKSFSKKLKAVSSYIELENQGFDQVPTGSNYSTPENFAKTVAFCKKHISPEHLLGFMQTTWKPTMNEWRAIHIDAVDQVGRVIERMR
jgi:hypothetical protein